MTDNWRIPTTQEFQQLEDSNDWRVSTTGGGQRLEEPTTGGSNDRTGGLATIGGDQ